MKSAIAFGVSLFTSAYAQWPCGNIEEVHTPFTWHQCIQKPCTEYFSAIVLESSLRETNCCAGSFDVKDLHRTQCKKKDKDTCPADCCVEGADYRAHGIKAVGTSLTMDLGATAPHVPKDLIRVMPLEDERYPNRPLVRRHDSEYTFDIDVRNVPPGYKARVSLNRMLPDGARSEKKGDKAGARYGTGYYDATCDKGQRFVEGRANYDGWVPDKHDPMLGTGRTGACCHNTVLWEGNIESTDYHWSPCLPPWYHRCDKDKCTTKCFAFGCRWNPNGNKMEPFYGPGPTNTIDSKKTFSVVTQFFIQQTPKVENIFKTRATYYVQGGKIFRSAPSDYRPNDDFAARMQWTLVDSFDEGAHPPSINVNGSTGSEPLRFKVGQKDAIILDASNTIDTDSQDDASGLDFEWDSYVECASPMLTSLAANFFSVDALAPPTGTNGTLAVNEAGFSNVALGPMLRISTNLTSWEEEQPSSVDKEWHVILQVTNNKGSYPIRRYRRVILELPESK
ncbi:cellulose 1,4-beta-cellobiosidase [Fusarium agapanthi]|uniref:Glucanase n=1 Tax=Fusarium agapanthi TaxID=1803897 RepID=A0A9P5E8L3_9HYPO|nr:cellulose 1,4-beta-cellobiosidase [Fusarium agapanthi]